MQYDNQRCVRNVCSREINTPGNTMARSSNHYAIPASLLRRSQWHKCSARCQYPVAEKQHHDDEAGKQR